MKKKKTVKKRKPAARKIPAKKRAGGGARPKQKMKHIQSSSRRILSVEEPKPFRVENVKGQGRGLILCDHASGRIPRALKDMGLKKADLKRHISCDIGAEDVSRYLSKALDMPVILANYSRLVIDTNRPVGHPEGILEVSDGVVIPANADLSKSQKARRYKEIFFPYQKQIERQINRFLSKKRVPVIVAIHSFTPELGGKMRPWHISVLWNKREKIAKSVISGIRRNYPGLLVGENEPYSLKDKRSDGSTVSIHAERRGLPYVFVELRQDLIDTKEKAAVWGGILVHVLRPVFENPDTFQIEKEKPGGYSRS
jgi:predicted N-formylglutamate amidohydrolase